MDPIRFAGTVPRLSPDLHVGPNVGWESRIITVNCRSSTSTL
jgi:hypothetical protein